MSEPRIRAATLKQPTFWRVIGAYWGSRERWGAWGLLLVLLVLLLVRTGLQVVFVVQGGEMTSALADQDSDRFFQAITIFIGVLIVGVPFASWSGYVQRKLGLYWRIWLTQRYLGRYLSGTVFYQLRQQGRLDNPDQRLEEDIRTVTQESLKFLVIAVEAGLQLLGFAGVLWTISTLLMGVLVGYSLVGTAIAFLVFGRVLVGINVEQLKREADFRFGLAHIRDHAEAIALSQGESQEQSQSWGRFEFVFQNFQRLIRVQLGLNLFQTHYRYATFVIPGLILAPQLFAGNLEIGDITQAGAAFSVILGALALLVLQLQQLTALAAGVRRLQRLDQSMRIEEMRHESLQQESLQHPALDISAEQIIMTRQDETAIALEHVTLITPDGAQLLVQDISLHIGVGEHLLVMGSSGVGKSSLLRAIAGLWTTGTGAIARPPLNQMMFLPQQAYLMAGTLREQLSYPYLDRQYPDEQFWQVLRDVNLEPILVQAGSLETPHDWARMLSPGEQQRLAFARLLLHQPAWAILDEATSALDADNEALLYGQLTAMATTVISVAHRRSLIDYHQQVLELHSDKSWQVSSVEELSASDF
jgi:ABC-type uncharacterized transport system fused permease/ATPase subunit